MTQPPYPTQAGCDGGGSPVRCWFYSTAAAMALGSALLGCSQKPGKQGGDPDSKSAPPVVKLLIRQAIVSASMPNALSKSSGGTADGGLGIKSQFEVESSQKDGGRTFLLRGAHVYFRDDEKVPEDQRGTFKVTADSESTIPVSVHVDCPVAVKVSLDGNEVAAPIDLTPGRHQLTITGHFKPGS